MKRLDIKDLESLLCDLKEGKESHSHQREVLEQFIDEYKEVTNPLQSFFNLEDWLYKQTDKPIEIKSSMIWGALWILNSMEVINWEQMKSTYGEFMSKQMGVR